MAKYGGGTKRRPVNEESFNKRSVGAYWQQVREARRRAGTKGSVHLSKPLSKVVVVNPKDRTMKIQRSHSENEALEKAIHDEKLLTREWYERMSLQAPWREGDRERYAQRFAELDAQIDRYWKIENAEWFASLPAD